MATRTNKRVLYANQMIGIRPTGVASTLLGGSYIAKGVQECGIATNFNNTPYFQMGALDLYDDVEQIPDVQITISKCLDGRPLLYHLATSASWTPNPTLAGRQNNQCIFTLGIFPDTNDFATGTPPSIVECSGMFPSSLQYTFPVNGIFTESMTLVGNDKLWKNDSDIVSSTDLTRSHSIFMTGGGFDADTPVITVLPTISGQDNISYSFTGIQQRQNLNFTPWSFYNVSRTTDNNGMAADPFCTILPTDIDGISSSGTNDKTDGTNFDAHIQNITISVNLGRTNIDELGRRSFYHRYINFPTEVTCSIQTITTSGDLVSATEGGILSSDTSACAIQNNLGDRTIRVATCHKEVFYLGTKNKLTSVEHGGGGTDGGNVTTTYNYRNYNFLTIMAFSDPHDNENAKNGVGTLLYKDAGTWWNTASDGTDYTGGSYVPGGYYLVN